MMNDIPATHSSSAINPFLKQGPVFIDSGMFYLRSLIGSDINERVLKWLTNSEMLAGLNLNALNFNLEQLRNFVLNFNNSTNYFIGIFAKKDNLLIGFYTIDVNLLHKVAMLTSGIGEPEYQGRYVYWKTIDALIDFFYMNRDIYKFTCRIVENNLRILFNFMNNPRFELEATLKNECLTPSGERVDILIFSSYADDGKKSAMLSQDK